MLEMFKKKEPAKRDAARKEDGVKK